MKTLTRKQREIRQREELFLDVAQKMILERGYLGINMDRIAEAAEYSKGTLYQHFTCKEDLIAGILLRTMEVRRALFARAATFRGRSRERMTAIGVADQLFGRMYPDHASVERITRVESIWDKASEDRRTQYLTCDSNCRGVLDGVIRDAVAQGDLEVSGPMSIEGILFGLWAMSIGAGILIPHGVASEHLGIEDPVRVLNTNYQVLLDGYGWRPLSTEWDYVKTTERAQEEVFADEFRKVGRL